MALDVFIAYSHRDRRLRDKLANFLSNLRRQELIDDWYDGDIVPGAEWKTEIIQHLRDAQIILLLISADFMASDFCYGVEMQQAIARHQVNKTCVIPIILRPTDWKGAPFSHLQVLPTSGKPVTSWSSQDAAFTDVMKGLRTTLKDLTKKTVNPLSSTASLGASPAKILISYSHEDEALVKELEKHLLSLRHQELIDILDKRAILPGTNWAQEISKQIDDADIILLLISPYFMASDYAYSSEMERILKRQELRQARVIPIILRATFLEEGLFGNLQTLPRNGRPVTSWQDRDEAFFDITNGIRSILSDIPFRRSPLSSEQTIIDIANMTPVRPSALHPLTSVFVLSGPPEVTFVAREDFVFLKLALEQPGRGVVIEGPSGVGKTTSVEKAVEDLRSTALRVPLPIQRILTARNPEDRKALQTLRGWHNGTVIVDDFHRLDPTIQQELVDYLKELADTASKTKKLAIVGIPRTGQTLVNMSFDIATRVDVFPMGRVKDELVLQMIEKGEEALNIRFDRKAEIVLAANGNFNLAQFMCYTFCAIIGITQTQEQTRVVQCDIDAATGHVMNYLARKFEESIRLFIAMGGSSDITGLRLLEELAMTEDGFLSLPLLKESKPDLARGIDRFIREHWMDKLYVTCPNCANHLFYDQVGNALVIDDPQLAFYLKKVRFSILAREVGKASTLAQRKVFISYSHRDSQWLERLRVHLKPVEREGIIDLWDDTKIEAGVEWKEAIKQALETARVAVLLVSADFLASDFIAEHELPILLAHAKEGGTTIIPVILSPSLFSSTGLGVFQSINAPRDPISGMTFPRQEEIFVNVAQIILERFKAG